MAFIVHIYESRAGQMERNMQSYYRLQTTKDLLRLRSQKIVAVRKLYGKGGHFTKLDVIRLERQIKWIDIELFARDAQLSLFE